MAPLSPKMEDCSPGAAALFLKSPFLPPNEARFPQNAHFWRAVAPNEPFLTPNFPLCSNKRGVQLPRWRHSPKMEAPILQLGAAGFPQTEPICPQNALFCPKSGSLMLSAPLAVLCAACSPFPCSLFSLPPHPRGAQPQNAAFFHPSADFQPQNGAFQAQNGSFVHPAAPARSLSAPEWKLCLLHCPPPISAAFVCSPKFPLFHPKTAPPLPFPFPVSHRNPCWPTEAPFLPPNCSAVRRSAARLRFHPTSKAPNLPFLAFLLYFGLFGPKLQHPLKLPALGSRGPRTAFFPVIEP